MAILGWLKSVHAGVALDERAYVLAVINEIWMLVDYIAGSSCKALNEVEIVIPDAQRAVSTMAPAEMLLLVSGTNARLVGTGQALPGDRAHMQIIRDALNVLVRPASGLSIAYTAIVTGPLRRRAASRFALAQEAYPNLAERGAWHRRLQVAILLLLALATGAVVWESAKVALGKALLQNLDTLRAQQTGLDAAKLRVELSLDPAGNARERLAELIRSAPVPLSSFRLCDRAPVLEAMAAKTAPFYRPIYGSAEERDICGRDYVLQKNFGIVHGALTSYTRNWPGMVGSAFEAARNVVHCGRFACEGSGSPPELQPGQDDVEFRVLPVLLVWGNFALPVIFSFIGSAIFVTLDHYRKVSQSQLLPKDYFLAPVRLALGLVVGACVGLFFSACGPMPQSSLAPNVSALAASLTLGASGVAFLAGFGAETVFILLEGLVGRVFALPAAPK